MSASIEKLHHKARRAIESGESSFRQAAEYLAEAQKLGATQRQSAKAIGKSPAWVNVLLKWRTAGYKGTPFGPQSKTNRAAVQATKQSRQPMTAEEAQVQKARVEFQTARAVAVARMFSPETKRIPDDARKELLKALRMLGSERPAERASAALMVETQRARLNLSWHDLIVPAEAESKVSEAA